MEGKKIIIAVVGGGSNHCSPADAAVAEAVGREAARRGAAVICGGLSGVMEAACRGASEEGGLTIGVLPGNDAEAANRYVQIPIVTGMGYARNMIVAKSASAVIAIDGEYGTLTEIAYALQSGIPVVGLDTWSLSCGGSEDTSIVRARNAAHAVEIALSLAAGRRQPCQ